MNTALFLKLDVFGALSIAALTMSLWYLGYCQVWSNQFFIGFFIALTWEIAHLQIPNFFQILLPHGIEIKMLYPIAHAIWDALILVCSHKIAQTITYLMNFRYLDNFAWWFVFLGIGVLLEFHVEQKFNGVVWKYSSSWWNPVISKKDEKHHLGEVTLIPVIEWYIAPIVFAYLIQ
jgi:hypothetical protein